MSIGQKIKKYLSENHITQKDLSKKMGISEKKLNRILNTPDNILNLRTFKSIVCALGISANKFF